ncbi:hypothetical protein [Lysinibacillus sp. NPDC059133]|uniref:hypothetical protein n=1 Tax=Lysinibacillus sp. NPDC059133 TaxID=3346737 RepID=UPI00368D9B5A
MRESKTLSVRKRSANVAAAITARFWSPSRVLLLTLRFRTVKTVLLSLRFRTVKTMLLTLRFRTVKTVLLTLRFRTVKTVLLSLRFRTDKLPQDVAFLN